MPYLMLACLSALWGTSFLMIKLAASGLDAFAFAFGRVAIAALALAALARIAGWRWPRRRKVWARLIGLSLIGQATPILGLGFASKMTTSADLALTMGVAPIATMLIARLMGLGEVWSLKAAIGLGIGLIGVALAVSAPADPVLYPDAALGRAMGLVVAVLYAIGALISATASKEIGPEMTATASMAISAALSCLVWLAADGWAAPSLVAAAPAKSLLALLSLGVFNTALAYLVYFRLVVAAGATFAALNNYIVPFVGLVLGALILGEPVALASLFGLGLVIAGVVVTGMAARGAPAPSAPHP